MFVTNPSFAQSQSNAEAALETPEQSFTDEVKPLLSSTPFNGLNKSRATRGERTNSIDSQPADMIVKNPLFGSGLRLKLVGVIILDTHTEGLATLGLFGANSDHLYPYPFETHAVCLGC